MAALTRDEALSAARFQYRVLTERVLDAVSDEDERATIAALTQAWDQRLERLSRMGRASRLTDDDISVLSHLQAVVTDPTLDPRLLVEWLDAYPDAVSDLFPPSSLTAERQTPIAAGSAAA